MSTVSQFAPISSSHQVVLSIGEAASRWSIHPNTLRKATDRGDLRCYRIGGTGHRRLAENDILKWLGVDKPDQDPNLTRRVVIYARVSSSKQSSGFSKGSDENDLARQISRLSKVAKKEYGESNPALYFDTGSGLSFTRKGFTRLLDNILAGKLDGGVVLCSHSDRLARFGTEVVIQICKAHGITVVFTEKEETESEQKELTDDLLSIITHFSARTYGQRSARTTREEIDADTVALARNLVASGMPVEHVLRLLDERELRTQKGRRISRHVLSKYLDNDLIEQAIPTEKTQNSFIQFHRDCLAQISEKINPKTGKAAKDSRLLKKEMVARYSRYCTARQIPQLSDRHVGIIMKKELGYTTKLNSDALTTYVNVALK